MLPMQFWPSTQSDDLPSAIVLARLKDVVLNNNVLYRLVKPTETGTEVVSVNRLCNVVPHRRWVGWFGIYLVGGGFTIIDMASVPVY
jgi:hypothetical protein